MYKYIFCCVALVLGGCTTGSTLRSAAVLQKGQVEISGGVTGNQFVPVFPVGIAAYGITDELEVELRYERDYVAFTPRVQVMSSENQGIDCSGFFEVGYTSDYIQWGPGVIFGKRIHSFEPYLSYRFRHFSKLSERKKDHWIEEFAHDIRSQNVHFVKVGSRYYPARFQSEKCQFFVDLEVGPSFYGSDVLAEWAGSIGWKF